jgi:hypothetical protein
VGLVPLRFSRSLLSEAWVVGQFNIRRIPQLLRIARDAQVAYVTLFRSRKLVAGTLGFTDFREFLLDVPAEDVLGGTLQV